MKFEFHAGEKIALSTAREACAFKINSSENSTLTLAW